MAAPGGDADIASAAGLVADPGRAEILLALSGRPEQAARQ
jgi:hypothetical protein